MAEPETQRESQVSNQCKRLAESITELHKELGNLTTRLEPVLTPSTPTPETDKTKEGLCPLAETLRVIADDLAGQISGVHTLTGRIEI